MRPGLKSVACAAICAAAVPSIALANRAHGHHHRDHKPRHVLLISVDGLHQSDLQQWVDANPGSTLAGLVQRGTNFVNARTSFPSDSFPGMLAMATGGTSKSTGVYYDDSYDRTYYPAEDTTCSGPQGTEFIYAEPVDKNPDALNGGVSAHNGASIDSTKLARTKNAAGQCVPVYPNELLRVNSIFDVIHNAGLRTAWSDKHPAYQLLSGRNPHSIDDLYTPEVNSLATSGPGPAGGDWTSSEPRIQTYDSSKVQAVLDQIAGKPSTCVDVGPCTQVGVPAIMGMNFQAVSVGQKLPDPGTPVPAGTLPTAGGYAADGSFNVNMRSAMQFVDRSLGQMVDALKAQGLSDSTEIIISAKHGQSPIDYTKLRRVNPDDINAVVTNTTGAQFSSTSALNQQTSSVTDDVALIWHSTPFQNKSQDMIAAFNQPANRQAFDIAQVISGRRLHRLFGDPASDARVPDVIIQPHPGGLYSLSKKKVAEHGGGAPDDRHVALLVVGPSAGGAATVDEPVTTTQVAPTILRFLGLNPWSLDAARQEGTEVLPAG
jgi:predicted AlkP superfamily pyrophosphatase or phosphodiesterase